MKSLTELSAHLQGRVVDLFQLKKEGKKIVGFFPGDFVPEELIYASGAIPVCLVHGGSPEAIAASSFAAVRLLCPFSKVAFGSWVLEQPYYRLIDLLVAPGTCNHLLRTADMWDYFTDVEVFRLGIPHEHGAEHALKHYLESLTILKGRLENLTGTKIDDGSLKDSIELYNRIRSSLRMISELRKENPSPFPGSDFISLNHASYYADPAFMAALLNSFYGEVQSPSGAREVKTRILLAGPNLAFGDSKVVSLLETLGADIVIEEICEGIRFYWENVFLEGDLLKNIAQRYLTNRIPCAFQGQGTKERYNFVERLVREFRPGGVVWYQLKYCETYDLEYHYFSQQLSKSGIPVLKIESEYDPSDLGQLTTRIEAFLNVIQGRGSHV